MRTSHWMLFGLMTLTLGCRGGKDDTDESATGDSGDDSWMQEDVDEPEDEAEDEEDDKPDDEDKPNEDEDDKPDDGEYKDCDDDFDPNAPCEGDYTTTTCVYDDMIWWCQDGVWLSEDDKP